MSRPAQTRQSTREEVEVNPFVGLQHGPGVRDRNSRTTLNAAKAWPRPCAPSRRFPSGNPPGSSLATASMSRRCCSGQQSYRISGTSMLARQHQISIVVVADPPGTTSTGHQCCSSARRRIFGREDVERQVVFIHKGRPGFPWRERTLRRGASLLADLCRAPVECDAWAPVRRMERRPADLAFGDLARPAQAARLHLSPGQW